jgi:hypothetical protein|tara:strand:+ start:26 stop:433 length:408 start_codon:yes stop_codon:yes gene_type:complete
MATKNNFVLNQNYESQGVDVTLLTVDYINSMAAEVNDCSDGTALGGIMLSRHAFAQEGVQILAEGPLVESGKQKTFMVRTDNLDTLSSTTTIAALQARLRTLDQSSTSFPNITADITGATVTETKLGILTAAAVS